MPAGATDRGRFGDGSGVTGNRSEKVAPVSAGGFGLGLNGGSGSSAACALTTSSIPAITQPSALIILLFFTSSIPA